MVGSLRKLLLTQELLGNQNCKEAFMRNPFFSISLVKSHLYFYLHKA